MKKSAAASIALSQLSLFSGVGLALGESGTTVKRKTYTSVLYWNAQTSKWVKDEASKSTYLSQNLPAQPSVPTYDDVSGTDHKADVKPTMITDPQAERWPGDWAAPTWSPSEANDPTGSQTNGSTITPQAATGSDGKQFWQLTWRVTYTYNN